MEIICEMLSINTGNDLVTGSVKTNNKHIYSNALTMRVCEARYCPIIVLKYIVFLSVVL